MHGDITTKIINGQTLVVALGKRKPQPTIVIMTANVRLMAGTHVLTIGMATTTPELTSVTIY